MTYSLRGWQLLAVILIIAVISMMVLQGTEWVEPFSSPSPTMEYSVCRNKGFSKEHCSTRFVPGAGRVSSGFYGKVISGSQGEAIVV